MNIIKCTKCHYSLIEEEVSGHICKEIIDYRIEADMVYFFDGDAWYPAVKLAHQPTFDMNKNNRRFDSTCGDHLFILRSDIDTR